VAVVVEQPKSFKTYEEQVDLLIGRGMCVADRERAIEKLRRVNYYRLSGYWYPFRMRKPGGDGRSDRFLPGSTFDDVVYPIAVSFYVGSGFNALLDARVAGLNKVLLALLIVWATDSGAYLFGRRFGMKKLAPTISPNKTVAGALGGIASAMVVTFIFVLIDGSVAAPHNRWLLVLYAIFFSIAGQFGDLVESAIKRHYGVKDSGKFIPGHGGVLDRFDSLLFVFPLMRILGLF